MKPKSDTVLALDIGSYSVKCAQLVHTESGIQLKQARLFVLEASSGALERVLKGIFQEPEAATWGVRIAASGSSLLVRRLTLPPMTRSELEGAIRFEAERLIPIPIDDCILDFQISGGSAPGRQGLPQKSMEVLLAAVKRDFVSQRLRLLENVGVYPEWMDADVFCLVNAFEVFGPKAGTETAGLLNIGHRGSSFTILYRGWPFFVREIPIGGLAVTQAVGRLKNLSDEEADEWKRQQSPQTEGEAAAATQKGFEHLVKELKQSVDYFENEAGEELQVIWASGGGALAAGMAVFLSEELGKDVRLWDAADQVPLSPEMDRPYFKAHFAEFAVTLGMGVRGKIR